MADVVATMQQAGFKPAANADEDFPPISGEYAARYIVLRPFLDKETQEKVAYLATWKIGQTLDGDLADNRTLSRFYKIGGKDFDGNTITEETAAENVKKLVNDAFTAGVQLDLSNTEAFEASFVKAIDAPCYIRAWHFSPKAEPDRKIQQFVIKTEKDLRKGSKETAAGKTSRAPF